MTEHEAYTLAVSQLPEYRRWLNEDRKRSIVWMNRKAAKLGRPLRFKDFPGYHKHYTVHGRAHSGDSYWRMLKRWQVRLAMRALLLTDFDITGDEVRMVARWINRAHHGHPAPAEIVITEPPDDGTMRFREAVVGLGGYRSPMLRGGCYWRSMERTHGRLS